LTEIFAKYVYFFEIRFVLVFSNEERGQGEEGAECIPYTRQKKYIRKSVYKLSTQAPEVGL